VPLLEREIGPFPKGVGPASYPHELTRPLQSSASFSTWYHFIGRGIGCRRCGDHVTNAEWQALSLRDGCLSRFQREHQPEHCADSVGLLTRKISAVRPGKTARNRQAEAGAAGVSCPTMIKSN
jgi:hypothetical protein